MVIMVFTALRTRNPIANKSMRRAQTLCRLHRRPLTAINIRGGGSMGSRRWYANSWGEGDEEHWPSAMLEAGLFGEILNS